MSEEEIEQQEKTGSDEAENNETDHEEETGKQLVELDGDDLEEMDEDEFDEEEEVDELEQVEEKPEIGAVMVLGQGDMTMRESNRGADDPGDNTLSEPQWAVRFGEMLFVSDRGNHRVLVWDTFPEEDGEPATIVLGQEDFADCLENRGITTTLDEMTSGLGDESLDGFTISQCQDDTLSQPAGIAVINNQLYIVDSGNHRVLRWNNFPADDGEPPNLVLGQDNLDINEANRRGVVGSGSLFFPMGIDSGDDQHVIVADKDNHRVLIWNKIPFNNGWNADICVGQNDFDEREPNRGEYDKCGPETLSFPSGVCYDAENDRLAVCDQGNNRVLIWNKLPNNNGVQPDLVLGQENFYSRDVNNGNGSRRTVANGMYFPTDVVFGKKGFFVSDTGNNRVLVWDEFPTEMNQPPDRVIGQLTFNECKFNRGLDAPTASSLNDPHGLFLEVNMDDEEAEERLYICDRGNSRVVIWDELPPSPAEELEDEEEHDDIAESEELMGDDDDFFAEMGEYDMLEEGDYDDNGAPDEESETEDETPEEEIKSS